MREKKQGTKRDGSACRMLLQTDDPRDGWQYNGVLGDGQPRAAGINPLRKSCLGILPTHHHGLTSVEVGAAHVQAGGYSTCFVPICPRTCILYPARKRSGPEVPQLPQESGVRSRDTQLEGWCDYDGNDQGRRQASSPPSPSWQLHRALGIGGIGQRPVAEDWAVDGRQLAEAGAGLLSTKHNPTPSLFSDSTIRDSEAQHSTPDIIPQCTGSLCALPLGRAGLTVLVAQPQRVNFSTYTSIPTSVRPGRLLVW